MPVDDVWIEPDADKVTWCWNICRRFVCAVIIAFSKIVIGVMNNSVLHNQSTLHHAIVSRQKGQGLITVLNHTSYLDAFLIPRILEWKYIVHQHLHLPWTPGAKEIIHKNKPQSLFFTLAKCLPIVRGEGVYQKSMNRLTDQLNRGEWVHIFPEGRIVRKGESIRYKWGVGRLIAECQIEPIVIPIYQEGMEDILPLGKPQSVIPRIDKCVTVLVGEPIDFKDALQEMKKRAASQEEIRKYLTDLIQEKMRDLEHCTKLLHSDVTKGIKYLHEKQI